MDSREQMIATISDEFARVQYDEGDGMKIELVTASITSAAVAAIGALAKYNDSLKLEVSEDTADLIKEARYDLVETLTMLQAATSKAAFVLRVDLEDAYKRAIESPEPGPDFSGL